ncbi:MAG: hypothetical protein ACRDTT_14110, partial [Pseudonocardiaceae bacterium]
PHQYHHGLRCGIKYSAWVEVSETCPRQASYAGCLHEHAGAPVMTESAADDEFDHITSASHLGSLLRRLRGDRTQQNITDHAKRQNLYVHRPDLSAIERGRRLPTANELRGILYGCGRLNLFDRLDGVRQHLMAQPADAPTSHDAHLRISYLPAAEPGVFPIRSRDLDLARRRKLIYCGDHHSRCGDHDHHCSG